MPKVNSKTMKQNQMGKFSLVSHQNINYSHQPSDNKVEDKEDIYVDLKGAVRHPGAYRVKNGQRIGNAIQKAGGYTDDADTNQVNLAQMVRDQMVVYVPHKGEKIPISGDNLGDNFSSIQSSVNPNHSGKVNLNLATIDQLKKLTGVGGKEGSKNY